MSPIEFSHHIDAFLLSIASSTDNFTVGLSLGIRRRPLPASSNLMISICNAAGAYVAGHGGLFVRHTISAGHLPLFLSSLAFGILAISEYMGYREETSTHKSKDEERSNLMSPNNDGPNMTGFSSVWKLAIPMTLNNLAGGVAGGAAGLAPELSAAYALAASFATMWLGYHIGLRMRTAMGGSGNPWMHPSLISAVLLGILCILTLQEAVKIP